MKKLIALFLTLTLTLSLVFLTGCGASVPDAAATEASQPQSDNTVSATNEPEGKQEFIGMSVQMMNNEFFVFLTESIKAKAEAAGMKFEVASADGSVAKQIEQLENFATMGVTTLVVMPVDVPPVAEKCKELRTKGIRVIAVGTTFGNDTDSYDVAYASDQYAIGAQCAKNASDWIDKTFPDAAPGSIEAVVLETKQGQENIDRAAGLMSLSELNPKVKIVAEYELAIDAPPTKAQEYMSIMRADHPDVKIVLGHFSSYGLAADETLMQDSGLDREHFGIFTCDWANELGRRIQASEKGESLIRASSCYGSDLSQDVMDAVQGKLKLDSLKQYFVPIYPVWPDNASQFMTPEG